MHSLRPCCFKALKEQSILSATQRLSRRRALVSIAAASAERVSQAKPLARAVRAVPIKVITVAKNSSGSAEACAGEWAANLQRYTSVQQKRVAPNPKRSDAPAVAVRTEAEAVLKALVPADRVVVLDERGTELDSEGIAQLIAKAGDSGAASLAFCIGGPHGHGTAVRERADVTLRLSACVLNHEVARIVLLEQLYRGWTILRGEPYHH